MTLDPPNILLIDGWVKVGIFPLSLVESILITEEEEIREPYAAPLNENVSYPENDSLEAPVNFDVTRKGEVVEEKIEEMIEEKVGEIVEEKVGEIAETEEEIEKEIEKQIEKEVVISTPPPQEEKDTLLKKKLKDPIFWITGLTIAGSAATAIAEVIPPEFSAIAGSAAGVMYLAARGINKLRAGEILEPPSLEGG